MWDMHMMPKIGTVCLRVSDPHFIFDRICVRKIRNTHASYSSRRPCPHLEASIESLFHTYSSYSSWWV